ncbi:hypothetical protein HIM_04052 [Hirsutella minnesotensis 3608]|uniref:G-patch domain-containing protein n=1 Tax=Hirsutella minnesotensis 3608 TaxID=1043627 RepID=A0A0F7ZLV7_9HYPO|nr:hypothetical protein HIM_04052 [Hirsutella minnesotensis 3608]
MASGGDDEDDYMNMTFEDAPSQPETSLQRVQRLHAERLARGRIKSKNLRAMEAAEKRETALATSLLDDPRAKQSKGLAMMAKMGFAGGTLGKKTGDGDPGPGLVEPIKIEMKNNVYGLGHEDPKKTRRPSDHDSQLPEPKVPKMDLAQYREWRRMKHEDFELQKKFEAAQRLALRLDEERVCSDPSSSPVDLSSRPAKFVPVVYRSLQRGINERWARQARRHRDPARLPKTCLPVYDDDEADADDKMALGDSPHDPIVIDGEEDKGDGDDGDDGDDEDDEDEDEDEDKFNALSAGERLARVIEHIRREHWYCMWCKMSFPDKSMDGCPGPAEDDHNE